MQKPKPDEVDWIDKNTPVICGTCNQLVYLGDGKPICKKKSKTNPPFMFAVTELTNSKTCQFWEKGREIRIKKEAPILTKKEEDILSRL